MGHGPIPKSEIKSLGFWLDAELLFRPQARRTAATCFGLLKTIRKILPQLPETSKKILFQSLIFSTIDYGNAIYLGDPVSVIQQHRTVQNSAARLLTGTSYRSSAKPALNVLHWLPVKERINFKTLCMAHKTIRGKGPPNLENMVRPYRARRNLRSNDQNLAETPRINRSRSSGRLFSLNAARLWNALPPSFCQEPNLLAFRKSVKTWLFPRT